jgi:hypothetical protein
LKSKISCLIAVLVFSLPFLTGCDSNSRPAEETPETVITPSNTVTTTPVPQGILTAREEKESQESPKYSIVVNFPYLEGVSSADNFNTAVAEFLEKQKAEFLVSVEDNEEWRSQNMPQVGNDMQVDYVVTYESPTLISIMFTNSLYIAGAAHPNSWVTSLNFDLITGKPYSLSDMFSSSTPYLETISEYCINELSEQETLQMPEGAQPEEMNYSHWNITGQGIRITFNPYQVAPYAAGIPQVLVPYEVLKPILSPDSPIWEFIQP